MQGKLSLYKGQVVSYCEQDHVVLDIDYKKRMVLIGIPEADNISRQKKKVSWEAIQKQTT